MEFVFNGPVQSESETKSNTTLWGIPFLAPRRVILLSVLFFFGLALYFGLSVAQAAAGDITETDCIGRCEDSLVNPLGIDVDSQGNLWVADAETQRVLKFSSAGELLLTLGNDVLDSYGFPQSGSGIGEFNNPSGISVDNNDNVYVLDRGNSRIQKFSISGSPLDEFGSYGSGNGEFSFTEFSGITTDNSGNVFVADTYNNRVIKYDAYGVAQQTITYDGENFQPYGVAVDPYGSIFAINNSQTIERFNAYGAHTLQIQPDGYPTALSADQNGSLYIANSSSAVTKHSSDGGSVNQSFGSYGNGVGELSETIHGIAIDSSGSVYISQPGSHETAKVEKFSNAGVHQLTIGKLDNNFDFSRSGIAYDSYGNLYVADSNNQVLRKYNTALDQTLELGQFGSYGSYSGQLDRPYDVDVDSYGNIYIADSNNGRVSIYNQTGDQVNSFNGEDTPNMSLAGIGDVKVDSNGNIFVIAMSEEDVFDVFKLNSSGEYQGRIATQGTGFGQYQMPVSLEIDSQNNIYIPDAMNGVVKVYSNTGTFLGDIGTPGDGGGDEFGGEIDANGELYFPYDVAIDEDDNVYVLDTGNQRIQKFNSDYEFVSSYLLTSGNFISDDDFSVSLAVHNGKIAVLVENSLVFLEEEQGGGSGTTTTTTTSPSVTTTTSPSVTTVVPDTDLDGDGVSDSVEDNGPNGGDGNNDGTPDSDQTNVSTFVNSSTGKYVTLSVPNGATITSASLQSASSLPSDNGYSYPAGVVSFRAATGVGATISVNVTFHDVSIVPGMVVRKIKVDGSNATFKTVTGATVATRVIGGKNVIDATYSITDGGTLDDDALANGEIVDPVGLAGAITSAPAGSSLPVTGADTDLLVGQAFYLLILGSSIVIVARRRRSSFNKLLNG